ncbi:MAG: thiamine-monophosphate kinase [Leptospiraceae bacterium]|nr:thiamine-monophosphate kinase [Leptospiraceae bacterium]
MGSMEQRIIKALNPDLSADDCALVEHGGQPYLYTTDGMAEGSHFRLDWSTPEDIAHKLIGINLSDLMAGGGEPEFCLLNVGIPDPSQGREDIQIEEFIERFGERLRMLLKENGCQLVGGDTFRSAQFLFSLTLSGPALYPRMRRAAAGDGLYISGSVGLSRLGYDMLSSEGRPDRMDLDQLCQAKERSGDASRNEENQGQATAAAAGGELSGRAFCKHLRPWPNLQAARSLNGLQTHHFPVHGSMDLSDGIFSDCQRFAESCGLDLKVDLDSLPLPSGIKDPLYAASSGEELEFLASSAEPIPGWIRIGSFQQPHSTPTVEFLRNGKSVQGKAYYEHFQD